MSTTETFQVKFCWKSLHSLQNVARNKASRLDATLIQASLVLYARLPLHVRHSRVNLQALECLNLLINRIFQEKVSNVHAERKRIFGKKLWRNVRFYDKRFRPISVWRHQNSIGYAQSRYRRQVLRNSSATLFIRQWWSSSDVDLREWWLQTRFSYWPAACKLFWIGFNLKSLWHVFRYELYILGQFLNGLGLAFAPALFIFLAESVPKKYRGSQTFSFVQN